MICFSYHRLHLSSLCELPGLDCASFSISIYIPALIFTEPNLGPLTWCAAKPIYWHWGRGEGKYSVYCRVKQGKQAAHVQKTRTPQWISGKGFKRQCEGEGHRVCDQLVHSSLVDGEVTGWCFRNLNHQLSGSSQSGVSHWWSACSQLLPPGGDFRICRTTQGYGSGYYRQPLKRNWRSLTILWRNYYYFVLLDSFLLFL